LFSYAAVDALLVFGGCDLDEFDAHMLGGQTIRLHRPQKPGAASIDDNQALRKMAGDSAPGAGPAAEVKHV
jgi:hypothetical protein